MHFSTKNALACLVGFIFFAFSSLLQARTIKPSVPCTTDLPLPPLEVEKSAAQVSVKVPIDSNTPVEKTIEGPEDEDEDEGLEYSQRENNHEARHKRRTMHKCTRHSKSQRCHKKSKPKKSKPSTKKPQKQSPYVASTAHHALGLASTGVMRSGDATYYGTGLGACGETSTDASMIAAVSHLLFDNFPGATANPNKNPICGRKVKATYKGSSVVVQIVDRCVGCKIFDLDFSPTAFGQIGPMAKGRLTGMKWEFM